MTKKKSKIAEFFSNVGTALAFIWMLPMFVVKGVQEHFEKKRKAKQPKPEPIKFVCSECGETFEADNVEKEMRNHASSNGDYTYSNPQPCPKCGGKRTRPTEFRDKTMIFNYVCTKCGTVVQKDIQPTSGSYPNRSAGHFWENLGEVGSTCWQCSHCGLTVYSKNQPNALICPKSGRYHDWRML
jgi:rubrerythrin